MIDNYDSFTYNLVQYLECLSKEVRVYRNDHISIQEIEDLHPEMIVLSPGPRTPDDAGICNDIVRCFQGKIPILGICLGHQTIGQVFGGRVIKALEPTHGKVHPIQHGSAGVFRNLPNPLQVTRYHSLVLERETLPLCFDITAETAAGEIMGIRHNEHLIEGVQFHPEAILTEEGMAVLENFLLAAKAWVSRSNHAH